MLSSQFLPRQSRNRWALALVMLLSFPLATIGCQTSSLPSSSDQNIPAAAPEPIVAGETALPEPPPTPTAVVAPTAIPTAAPVTATERYAALRQSIDKELKGLNGEWGIAVQDLSTGDTMLMNTDRPYPAASLYKLVLLAEAYRRIDAGTLQLDQMTTMVESDYVDSLMWDEELAVGDRVSLKGLLRVLIIQSSNAAAHALMRIMSLQSINDPAQGFGLNDTFMPVGEIRARYSDWRAEEPATSVPDLLRFFGKLYRGELISPQASKAMLDLLKQQQINDRIPALLPKGTAVAHKTGNLTGVVADAGIIFGPRTDVMLIVLNDGADHDPATAAIGNIGRLVYDFHNQ